ncbi:MAG: hypothetical protein AB8B93_04450 [Pseudomonadales bacterium]
MVTPPDSPESTSLETSSGQALAAAREKLIVALTTQAEQRRAYESDELFMYLWRRGWNTSEYQGTALGRLVDGWIAGFCGFEKARAAYWMLNEIPERLRSRIDALEADLA